MLGGVVEGDGVQQPGGDLLGGAEDGLQGGTADEVREAADHAGGALVEIAFGPEQGSGGVAAQPQRLFEGRDESFPFGAARERVGGDQTEASSDLPSSGAGEQALAFDVDPGVDECGGDAFGEVLEGVGYVRAGAGGQGQVVDLVADHDADPGVGGDPADCFDDVGDVGAGGERQAEEAGELCGDHARGRRGRDGDVDDRDPVGRFGVTLPVDRLMGLAELGDRGGLPGAGCAGQDQAAAGADGVPVEQGQPASGVDDLPQRRGSDRGQAGVVVQPHLVVSDAVGVSQRLPLRFAEQVGCDGDRGGELPPAFQGG